MTDYTRLTVIGASRKADLVVPNDEIIGALIPRLMELLDERPGAVSRPLTLVRATGEQLDTALSAADQLVEDGEVLRLVRQDDAPPPPEVADVTDVLADSLDDRAGRWSRRTRRAVWAAAVGLLALVAGWQTPALPAVDPVLVLAVTYAAGAVVGLVAGLARLRWVATVATATAVGTAAPLAAALAVLPETPSAFASLTLTLVWLALALGAGVGLRQRPALAAGVIGTLLAALPLGLDFVGVDAVGAVGIATVAAVVLAGLLPWYAMSASGLTGLDDQIIDGERERRDRVLVTIGAAYRTLTWSAFAVAAPVALGAWVLLGQTDWWAVGLGGAALVAVALRTRALPLAAQGVALWGAVVTGVVAGSLTFDAAPRWIAVVALVAVAIAGAIGAGVRPAAHQRASMRRLGNAVEMIAVIALFPVLLGVFGVYADLLAAFG